MKQISFITICPQMKKIAHFILHFPQPQDMCVYCKCKKLHLQLTLTSTSTSNVLALTIPYFPQPQDTRNRNVARINHDIIRNCNRNSNAYKNSFFIFINKIPTTRTRNAGQIQYILSGSKQDSYLHYNTNN